MLKQTVHPNMKWLLGYPFLLAFLILTYMQPNKFYFIIIPLCFVFYGFDYVFETNKSYIQLCLFGFVVFKCNKRFIKPNYISLFKQDFTRGNAFGFFPQILGDDSYSLYTIKLFNDTENEIVFESEDEPEVLKLGAELASILNVELYNAL